MNAAHFGATLSTGPRSDAPGESMPDLDPRMEPTPFHFSGPTRQMLTRWAEALQAEHLRDVVIKVGHLGFWPKSGLLKVDNTNVPYCWRAFGQLFDRAAEAAAPTGALAKGAWYLGNQLRSMVFAETRLRGGKTEKRVTVRLATDCHGAKPTGREYVRGIVSDQHSQEKGDDLNLARQLMEPLLDGEWAARFANGRASITRDPADMTYAWLSSATVYGQCNARLSIHLANSEVGAASLRSEMALAFTVVKLQDGEEDQEVHVVIPVDRAVSRTVHRGDTVTTALSKLGEHLQLATIWAPTALEKLATTMLPASNAHAWRSSMIRELVARNKVSNAAAEERTKTMLFRASKQSPEGSALQMVIALSLCKLPGDAKSLVREVAGGI